MKLCFAVLACVLSTASFLHAAGLRAGVAKVDVTDHTVPVNDPSYAKALVVSDDATTAVLITVDAVSIGEIGRIGNGFMATVRSGLEPLGIKPSNIVVNASHCHGMVRADLAGLVVQAVGDALKSQVPVLVGDGSATEDRICENRRLKMKDGTEIDMRRAYSMPRDEDVASVGPIDPQIGLLRLDRTDGTTLAVVYQFACHPIMNPPNKGSSADYPAHASQVIEESLGHGAMAFFIQGCGGDINPIRYKEVSRPADAEPLGNKLGLSAMRGVRAIQTKASTTLKVTKEVIAIPRATDYEQRIAAIEGEQKKLLASLKPTNINFKSFLSLWVSEKVSPEFPSHYSQSYLHDRAQGRDVIEKLDADNHASVMAYLQNLQTMEQLTRLNTNLALLKKHLAETKAAGRPVMDVEVCGLRVGDFKLVTFPGELTVRVGLNIKQAAKDPHAFVSGYTNGYIYYTATVEQRTNKGYAQEDCDVLVAPGWQKLFESKALQVLRDL